MGNRSVSLGFCKVNDVSVRFVMRCMFTRASASESKTKLSSQGNMLWINAKPVCKIVKGFKSVIDVSLSFGSVDPFSKLNTPEPERIHKIIGADILTLTIILKAGALKRL